MQIGMRINRWNLWRFSLVRQYGNLSLYLVGLFGWVAAVPLYGSVAGAWAAAHHRTLTDLPLWFLFAHAPSLVLSGIYWDRQPAGAVRGGRAAVAVNLLLTLLVLLLPVRIWPLCFAAMGVSTAVGMTAWGRWYATTVDTAWLGRVFGLTAAGVGLLDWLYAGIARHLLPGMALALTLLPLALAWAALRRFDDSIRPARSVASLQIPPRVKTRLVIRFGLFIIFFSVVAGLSDRFLIASPITPFVDETLRRLPYIIGVLAAGVLADRRNLHSVLVAGAALLAFSFLVGAWGSKPVPEYSSITLNGLAFGLLEPAPWLLLASSATPRTAGRWFGWGLNLNVIPILFGALVALPLGVMTPERLGLLAAVFLLLAILFLTGVTDPLTVLHNSPQPVGEAREVPDPASRPDTARGPVPVPDLLERHYGTLLSKRELEIGRLVIAGVATRDIVRQMYISENTIKTHLKSLYRKTQTANRNDLYRKLVEEAGREQSRPNVFPSAGLKEDG